MYYLFKSHLKEMDVRAIGDRVYLLDMISKLKKKKMELETTAALWSGETPAEGIGKNKCNCKCSGARNPVSFDFLVFHLVHAFGTAKGYRDLHNYRPPA